LTTKACPFHHVRLIPKRKQDNLEFEPGVLICVKCGYEYSYLENEAPAEEHFEPEHNKSNQTKIISAKKNKKYYDKQGNEITDETLIQDIQRGANVISYKEEKHGEDKVINVNKKSQDRRPRK
jgi:DNA-directed RNA polymerase subunit M/transcription elongation factor TFIIS